MDLLPCVVTSHAFLCVVCAPDCRRVLPRRQTYQLGSLTLEKFGFSAFRRALDEGCCTVSDTHREERVALDG